MKIVSHVIISYNEYLNLFAKIIVQHEGPDQAHIFSPLQPFLRALRGKKMKFEKLSNKVIGCAIEVHSCLGPGLLESTYEQCLAHELHINGIDFKKQHPLPVNYKGICLDCGYKIDLLIENELVIELKSVAKLEGIHEAQLLMKLANIRTGLLINFNVTRLKDGIKRFVL